jgi:hypothetical protein
LKCSEAPSYILQEYLYKEPPILQIAPQRFRKVDIDYFLWVFWGEQEGIFRVLVLDGRLQDERCTRCGS